MTSFKPGPRTLARSMSIAMIAGGLVALPVTSFSSTTQDPVNAEVEEIPIQGISKQGRQDTPKPNGTHPDHDSEMLRPAVITDPIETESEFGLVGIAFDQAPPEETAVQVRVRESAGWSDWQDLDVSYGHGPDQDSPEFDSVRPTTEPLLTGPSNAVQVRVDVPKGAALPQAEVQAVEATQTEADATATNGAGPAAQANAATAQPAIILRAGWGADERLRNGCPGLTDAAKIGFVHHTASTSNYAEVGAPSQLRSIYSWTTSNGYCDMPYNFFVDKYGNTYEGRGGGISMAVQSGATASFNSGSFSVAALGNYSENPSNGTASTTDAIARLAAWKLSLTGRSATGTEALTAGGYPGGAARGTVQIFNRISGHRDAISTSCPGDTLYPQLGIIRERAMGYQSWSDETAAPVVSTSRYTSSVTDWSKTRRRRAVGKFYKSSFSVNPREVRPVVIKKKRPGKKWKTYAALTTDSNGYAAFQLKFRRGTKIYRITVPKTETAKSTRNSKIFLSAR
jgi:hypothetical protein